jgi:hypothetical protein
MKLARRITLTALSLFLGTFLLGAAALMQAQDQREEPKPDQPEKQQDEKKTDTAKPAKENPKDNKNNDSKDKSAQNEDNRAKQEETNRTSQGGGQQAGQMGGQQGMSGQQRGGRIPDDKFRANFGRQHTFTIQRPTVVSGQSTFQYGGYSFNLVDVWPAGWAYTDQCYIDYIDGEYFLFDLAHPGVRLAIVVVL